MDMGGFTLGWMIALPLGAMLGVAKPEWLGATFIVLLVLSLLLSEMRPTRR